MSSSSIAILLFFFIFIVLPIIYVYRVYVVPVIVYLFVFLVMVLIQGRINTTEREERITSKIEAINSGVNKNDEVVVSPLGIVEVIPVDKVNHALKQGSILDPRRDQVREPIKQSEIFMINPSGIHGTVPADQLYRALNQGYTFDSSKISAEEKLRMEREWGMEKGRRSNLPEWQDSAKCKWESDSSGNRFYRCR